MLPPTRVKKPSLKASPEVTNKLAVAVLATILIEGALLDEELDEDSLELEELSLELDELSLELDELDEDSLLEEELYEDSELEELEAELSEETS
jgi:hypothetical protein